MKLSFFKLCIIIAMLISFAVFGISCGDDDDDDDDSSGDDDDDDDDDSFGFIVCSQAVPTNDLQMNIVTVGAPMADPDVLVEVDGHSAIDPVVTPDGETIIFSANFEKETPTGNDPPGGSLYSMSATGGTYARVTDDNWMEIYERYPSVSPDGTTILFQRSDASIGPLEALDRLWMVNLDGSDKHAVFDDEDPRNDFFPAYSLDGTMLTYISDNGGNYYDVMVYDLEAGTDPVNLTNHTAVGERAIMPFFSADGQWVYYLFIDPSFNYYLNRVSTAGGTPETVFDIPEIDMPNHGVDDTFSYWDFKPTKDRGNFVLNAGINDAIQVYTTDALSDPFNPDAATDTSWDCLFPYWYKP